MLIELLFLLNVTNSRVQQRKLLCNYCKIRESVMCSYIQPRSVAYSDQIHGFCNSYKEIFPVPNAATEKHDRKKGLCSRMRHQLVLEPSQVLHSRVYAQHAQWRAAVFPPFRSVRNILSRRSQPHIGICKATCHCEIVLLTQINCVRRNARGNGRRYKIERLEAPRSLRYSRNSIISGPRTS